MTSDNDARDGTNLHQTTIYGYARVSTNDQNLDRQMDALATFGVAPEMVFADHASGKDFDRPQYQRLMAQLNEGDVPVVTSIDRLGRNYEEILDEWRQITKERHAAIVVLDMPVLDTRTRQDDITGTLISDIVLQLLSYVAQVERENIRQRQAEGIASALARGVKFGRPKKEKPAAYETVKGRYLHGAISQREAARQLDISVATFHRWLQEDGDAAERPA